MIKKGDESLSLFFVVVVFFFLHNYTNTRSMIKYKVAFISVQFLLDC